MSIVKFIKDYWARFIEKIHHADDVPLVRIFHLVPDALLPDDTDALDENEYKNWKGVVKQFEQLDLPPVIRPKKSTAVKKAAKKTTKKIGKKTKKLVEKKAKK